MLCPVIGLLLLAIVAWLTISGLKIRELSKAPAIACGRCGHFLDQGQLRCPECGTLWDIAWLARLSKARKRSGTTRLVIAAVLALLIVTGVVLSVWDLVSYVNAAKAKYPGNATAPATAPP